MNVLWGGPDIYVTLAPLTRQLSTRDTTSHLVLPVTWCMYFLPALASPSTNTDFSVFLYTSPIIQVLSGVLCIRPNMGVPQGICNSYWIYMINNELELVLPWTQNNNYVVIATLSSVKVQSTKCWLFRPIQIQIRRQWTGDIKYKPRDAEMYIQPHHSKSAQLPKVFKLWQMAY